jgi:hypothetical protein
MSQNVAVEKDSFIALALASGTSVTAAAEQAGVDRKTVQRRLADPAFRRMVAEYRSELIASALGRTADNMTRAAETLAAMLDAESPALRIRAARALMTLGMRLRDSVDLNDRMREVEEELARKLGVG